MADSGLIRPGATFGVQDFRQAIYEKKPVNALFKCSKFHHYFPQSGSVRGSMGGRFEITATQKILDFSQCFLYMKIRLMQGTGRDANKCFPPNTKVFPINNVLKSVFKTLKTTVGSACITNHESNFAYTAYMKDLLDRSYGNRTEMLEAAGFYLDDSHQFNTFEENDRHTALKNSGADKRLRRFARVTQPAEGETVMPIDWESTDGIGGKRHGKLLIIHIPFAIYFFQNSSVL